MSEKIAKILTTIGATLLLICVVAYVVFLGKGSAEHTLTGMQYFNGILRMLVAGFGVYYILFGCSKVPGAVLYKIYLVLYIFMLLCAMLNPGEIGASVCFVANALSVTFVSILLAGKNLGQKLSLRIAAAVAFCQLVPLVVCLLMGLEDQGAILDLVLSFVIALSNLTIVIGKFADKKARGRKI